MDLDPMGSGTGHHDHLARIGRTPRPPASGCPLRRIRTRDGPRQFGLDDFRRDDRRVVGTLLAGIRRARPALASKRSISCGMGLVAASVNRRSAADLIVHDLTPVE